MERIFEEINRNSFRKLDKKILTNQMRDINSHKIIRSNKSDECPINNEDDCQSIEKNYFQNDSSYFNEQNNEIDNYLNNLRKKKEEEKKNQSNHIEFRKVYNRKVELNQNAKKILNDFHHKTHFKAVSMIANHHKDQGTH
jgi:hypothetical protein